MVGTTICGDKMYIKGDAFVVELYGQKRVASSSMVNGGCRDGMRYLYNYTYCHSPLVQNKIESKMEEANLEEHYIALTKEIGLPFETTIAMGTAAKLEERAEVTHSFYGISVSAIVTAGVDHNGGRAGDPPSYDELLGTNLKPTPGTINIMLFIDAKLPCGVLNQAIITATEAKAVALQELQAGSHYSSGIATGSGTDTIMVVSNSDAPHPLYDAGKHSQLGSIIGRVVIEATKKALSYHGEGMTRERQATLLWQGYRYGITIQALERVYMRLYCTAPSPKEMESLMTNRGVAPYIAPILHLRDQLEWGLITLKEYEMVRNQYLEVFLKSQDYSHISQALMTFIREEI